MTGAATPHSLGYGPSAIATGPGRMPLPAAVTPNDLIECIDGMRAGEEDALERLYEATVGKVHALSRTILRDEADAEENTCQTYASAWAAANRYDPSRASVIGWLLLICRSRAIERLRRRRRVPATLALEAVDEREFGEVPAADDLLDALQRGTRVHEALETLSPERRRLVGLAFLRGLSHQEIATACQMPLGTVKSHLRRALLQLRATLERP